MRPRSDTITIGYKNQRVDGEIKKTLINLSYADRERHCHVLGKTRMGKSALLETMMVQDIANGHGLAFIDPHGVSAEALLDYVPNDRVRDVVYFNPNDLDFPIGFSPFHQVPPDKRHLVVENLVLSFKHFWKDSWGARLEYILDNTLRTVLSLENGTFVHAYRLLVDPKFCKRVLEQTNLPKWLRDFWTLEMPTRERDRREWVMPVVNKLGPLIKSEPVAHIMAQRRNKLLFDEIMNKRRILIVNLSSRQLGSQKNKILGSMIICQLLLTAMARTVDADDANAQPLWPFYLYIDECQNFITEAIADITSEAGKFGLYLTLAHQYMRQLRPEIRDAVLGNIGTTIAFKVGGDDASLLETEFGARSQRDFGVRQDFLKLRQHEVCARLSDDYVTTFWTNAPLWEKGSAYPRYGNGSAVKNWSRTAYGKPRQDVEREITQLWGERLSEGEPAVVKLPPRPRQKMNTAA